MDKDTPAKVLVLDDDPVFCSMIAGAANELNIQVDCFYSLLEIDLLHQKQYDAAIVDYHLGPTTGDEAAKFLSLILHGNPQDTPIVIVSSDTNIANCTHRWPCEVQSFVSKQSGVFAILKAVVHTYNQ